MEEELTRLVEEGTLEPVDYSDWAAPIVAVVESDQKSVHVCDFKMTVNPVSKLNRYPIPKVENFFCHSGERENVHEIGFESSVPTVEARYRVQEVHCH